MADDSLAASIPLARSRPVRPGAAIRAHHAAVLAAGGAALAGAAYGLARGLENRVGLEIVLGGGRVRAVLLVLALGVLCAAVAILRRAAAWRAGRWGETSLAPLRALLCAAVLVWLGYAAFLQPFQRLTFDLALGASASGYAAWLALRRLSPGRPSRALRALDFLLFQACLVALGVEAGLRAWAVLVPTPILTRADGDAAQRIREWRIPPGDMHLGFPHNSRGYYDEEFGPRRPGVRRVVALSDSYGFGIVPHPYHYTTVAEELCGEVEVLNMGVPSAGPPEYLHLLRTEVPALEPDLVVVCLFVGNDIGFDGREKARLDPLLRSWFDRDGLLAVTVLKRRAKLAAERERLAGHGGPIPGVWGGGEVPGRIEDPADLARAFAWTEDPLIETPGMSEEAFLVCELARGRDACSGDREFYAPFFAALEEIRRAAGATPLAVLLIPDELQVEDAVWHAVVEGLAAMTLEGAPALVLERDRPQRWIGMWLEEHGIACEDLLPRLLAVPPLADGRRHCYHLRDTHFNRRGCRVAGEGLAELIEKALGGQARR